ncbi:unnamed protein product [Heligmosomoides polygyrus]|uniref:HTH_48 domain-containing protein n=1 Tax=Heligmosomoides polygyrus TaxID=6339 RepID=A0A3P8AIQ0_HELPZ|nr:unnamed protein product [Heligmosomoides polygyrus]
MGTTAKEADEKINAAFGQRCSTIRTAYRWYQGGTRRSTPHSVKDVPQFGRRIVGIRSCGMEMTAAFGQEDVPQFGRLGTTAKEADEKINAAFGQGCSTIRTYRDEHGSRSTVFKPFKRFRDGNAETEDKRRTGRPIVLDRQAVISTIEGNPSFVHCLTYVRSMQGDHTDVLIECQKKQWIQMAASQLSDGPIGMRGGELLLLMLIVARADRNPEKKSGN